MKRMDYHNPVLLKETVDGLNIREDGVYVDVTFGGGGHSKEILKRLGTKGKLFAFDQDADALENTIHDDRFTLIHKVLWCERSGWYFGRFWCFIPSI